MKYKIRQRNSRPPKQQIRLSVERRLFRFTLTVYGYLTLAALVPIVGLLVLRPFSFTRLLWFYISIAALSIIFPAVFITVRNQVGQNLAALLSAFRWSVVVVGLIGLLLWPSVLIIPGYKIFLAGYRLHVKIWLDPVQVRQWAAARQIAAGETSDIPYSHWPASLKKASLGSRSLTVDSKGERIALVEGGGFGHWGIEIAAPDSNVPEVKGYVLNVAQGVWVWHELQ